MTKTRSRAATTRRPEPAPAAAPLRERVDRPLTETEKLDAFRTATRSITRWYAAEIARGMTDDDLKAALERVLGIWGGSAGPGELDVSFQGSGLRIWATWTIQTHHGTRPLFAGQATIATAREVYGIGNPADRQMRLF